MRILILSFSSLLTDPRVIRQLRILSQSYEVTAAGFTGCEIPGVEFVPIDVRPRTPRGRAIAAMLLKARRYEAYYWSLSYVKSAWQRLHGRCFDAILANDINTLPLALKLAGNRRVLFDAHEYSPREFEESWVWRFFLRPYYEYLCRTYLPRVSGMLTVSRGIADEYRRVYGVEADVVANASPYWDLEPLPVRDHKIRLVHHGAASPMRKLEAVIQLMDLLDERFSLDLLLVPVSRSYVERLRRLAQHNSRIMFREPVPMNEIPRRTNCYDIGISYLPPTNFNNYHALPNKFFEFIQARLAVAAGPSPEMAAIVNKYECGVIADSFSVKSLANKLNGLSNEHISYYKRRTDAAARDLCF